MFTDPGPRLFGLPPGVDFGAEVARGLDLRLAAAPPEAWGRMTIYVNTRRMQRRLLAALADGPPRLTPRLRLITDLATDPVAADLPLPSPPLRRRLELLRLVTRLVDVAPDLAPRTALFDLSDSLAALLDEMQGEGVSAAAIAALDVSDQSGHWARAVQFITTAHDYLTAAGAPPGKEQRQRQAVIRLAAIWAAKPPTDPVIVIGSTGSRGSTALLIDAVARLPQGAVVLPGFDFDLPGQVWHALDQAMTGEDHPQFRFRRIMQGLGIGPPQVVRWTDTQPPDPARNRLISLSLRPAPITDAWLDEGPRLGDLVAAAAGLTLVQAATPRAEAEAIALRLRAAADAGLRAALITPDRGLTRAVAAALDRWGIIADDSAGTPLALSPPGRLLRQVAELGGARVSAAALLALLKHPLCNSGPDRGLHLLWARDLELTLRRKGPPYPDGAALRAWAAERGQATLAWAGWLADWLDHPVPQGDQPLTGLVARHLARAAAIAAGPQGDGAGALWDKAAGRDARMLCDDLLRHADAAGPIAAADYPALFAGILAGAVLREPDRAQPGILIWGTLEARVQGADLVILGGLNEGIWPEAAAPDPWLNRRMRAAVGLLLPERRIGLSAHDYAQAVAAPQVWLSRAVRSADAATVPSRWLNRLTNLMAGLPDQHGPQALAAMGARGDAWLAGAAGLSRPAGRIDPFPRPAPQPPVAARPRRLSVTAVTTLLRDPYAVYAQEVLRLRLLPPLAPLADAPLRGTLLHKVFETYLARHIPPDAPDAGPALLRTAARVLAAGCPWPMQRSLWLARIARIADWFIETERDRQTAATPHLFEEKDEIAVPGTQVTLVGKADRIDLAADGRVWIYDYKTGVAPTAKAQKVFDKQLLIEAAMAEQGAFRKLGRVGVAGAAYLGVGTDPKQTDAPLADLPPALIWAELQVLLARWADPALGYAARRAMRNAGDVGDFDHLSRFGEWDMTATAVPVRLR